MATSINPRDVPIDPVREYARDRAEQTSIRHLAADIGLGHSTVHNFLNGAAPHPRVRRRLVEWYLARTGQAPEYAEETYAAALDVLVRELPAESRDQARGGLLRALAAMHDDLGLPVPPWLASLRGKPE
jgi:hypothetical protein